MVRRTSLSSSQAPYCSRGVTLAGFEITHAEALRPFVLIGAVVIIVAAGLWLLDEFIWPLWRD